MEFFLLEIGAETLGVPKGLAPIETWAAHGDARNLLRRAIVGWERSDELLKLHVSYGEKNSAASLPHRYVTVISKYL